MTAAAGNGLLMLYQRCYAQLRAFVQKKVGCPTQAADIVQDVYLRLVGGASGVPVVHAQAYLYRVAGNLVVDHLRRESVHRRTFATDGVPEHVECGSPGAEAQLLARERLEAVVRAVEELPPRCREVFILCKVDGLDQAEVAQRLRISRKMVERHLRKALLHCQERLSQGS
jgi:RNA polymerase sigma factor (sigma-70 family)